MELIKSYLQRAHGQECTMVERVMSGRPLNTATVPRTHITARNKGISWTSSTRASKRAIGICLWAPECFILFQITKNATPSQPIQR